MFKINTDISVRRFPTFYELMPPLVCKSARCRGRCLW